MNSVEEIQSFCSQRGKKKLVLDTQLFCLLIAGICMKGKVAECNLTSSYNDEHWELLESLFRYFKGVYITPHILAEVSNLARKKLASHQHEYYFRYLIERLRNVEEQGVPLDSFGDIQCYLLSGYGYTDIGIVKAAQQLDAVIMTSDANLHAYAVSNRQPSVNFESVRTHGLLVV